MLDEIVDDPVIKVLSSEMGVTGGGEDLEDSVLYGKKGDIEGTATEVIDDDLRLRFSSTVETVR